jgi:hypothetical protein
VGFMEQSQVLEVMEMQAEMIRLPTKYLHVQSTEQCLASYKLLTTHPLFTQRVCPSPAPKGTHSPGGEGGGSIFWKTPDIGLAS